MQANLATLLAAIPEISLCSSVDLYGGAEPGLPLLQIEGELGSAVIALQGAHLLSFIPKGGRELLWRSPNAVFAQGKAIRGGIPLCMPWFGAHPAGLPSHGFARVSNWDVLEVEILSDGAIKIALELADTAATRALWPHACLFRLEVSVGHELNLQLSVENRSETAAAFSQAFHSYLAVPDVQEVTISGLDQCTYVDTLLDGRPRLLQVGDLSVQALTDRVYLNVPTEQVIKHSAGQIKIVSDTRSAIVWNPWEGAAKMADVGAEHYHGFVCVERGDVLDNAVSIAAGGVYRASMTLSE
ncbi:MULTISPECIES: D-hexose-6-phosphate mutarotase [unclassified Iodobacter]|uniref:D-hexose-6-phosphate mutarotase n=1 Tax=unclassified Iodobacter TaxID=235634 RepID=UPI0025FDBC14|nr:MULTISPECIES: D-hexose-6-phosphate mutarotase [unclassified Iodobacter]MDW5417627.1 D-hexose-6-phosphate mutarotase [Iodobacter sp. CM08]